MNVSDEKNPLCRFPKGPGSPPKTRIPLSRWYCPTVHYKHPHGPCTRILDLHLLRMVELPDKAELYTSVKKLDWRVGDWCVHPGSKQMPIETVAYPDADFRSMDHLFRQCASLEELRVWRNQEDPWGGVFIRHFLPYVPRDKPLSRLKRVSFHYPIDWMDELDKSQVTCSYDIEALRRLPPGAEIQPTLLK